MDRSTQKPLPDASLAEKTELGVGETEAFDDNAARFDPHVLRRLKLKADIILLPLLTIAYLLK